MVYPWLTARRCYRMIFSSKRSIIYRCALFKSAQMSYWVGALWCAARSELKWFLVNGRSAHNLTCRPLINSFKMFFRKHRAKRYWIIFLIRVRSRIKSSKTFQKFERFQKLRYLSGCVLIIVPSWEDKIVWGKQKLWTWRTWGANML